MLLDDGGLGRRAHKARPSGRPGRRAQRVGRLQRRHGPLGVGLVRREQPARHLGPVDARADVVNELARAALLKLVAVGRHLHVAEAAEQALDAVVEAARVLVVHGAVHLVGRVRLLRERVDARDDDARVWDRSGEFLRCERAGFGRGGVRDDGDEAEAVFDARHQVRPHGEQLEEDSVHVPPDRVDPHHVVGAVAVHVREEHGRRPGRAEAAATAGDAEVATGPKNAPVAVERSAPWLPRTTTRSSRPSPLMSSSSSRSRRSACGEGRVDVRSPHTARARGRGGIRHLAGARLHGIEEAVAVHVGELQARVGEAHADWSARARPA